MTNSRTFRLGLLILMQPFIYLCPVQKVSRASGLTDDVLSHEEPSDDELVGEAGTPAIDPAPIEIIEVNDSGQAILVRTRYSYTSFNIPRKQVVIGFDKELLDNKSITWLESIEKKQPKIDKVSQGHVPQR